MPTYDIAVIGAGVFGSWSAWRLARAGQRVLLVDAWGPGHSRSSSGDESRIIRCGYGADEIYTRMALRSLALWKELFAETRQPLFHRTGVLRMARAGDPGSEATRITLARAGVAMEILRACELAARYPQMGLPGEDTYGILEPESGVLMARRAVAAVVDAAVARGVTYATQAVLPPPLSGPRLAALPAVSGDEIHAGAFVFACGPWLPKLFPDLLGRRIHPTRQEILFFAPAAGDSRFAPPHLPAWVDFIDPRGPFGVPDLEGRGLKVGFDRHGPAFDPDSGSRTVTAEGIAEARRFLAERFPPLRDAPLTETRVCQYENSVSGDFLIDRHPDYDNVWLAGGGSGHGFKHGPAVGEYVHARMAGECAEEPRFGLAAHGEARRRTVH